MAKRDPLDVFALNIGRLCNEWQHLEFVVCSIFCAVAGVSAGPIQNMAHCLSQRDLIRAIKVGVVAAGDTPEWATEVTLALNYIDNILRPRRNRYVHDGFWEGCFGVMRHTREPRLARPQSRRPVQLETQVRVEDIKHLRDTVKSVKQSTQWLWQLDTMYEAFKKHGVYPVQLEGLRPPLLPQGPTGLPPPDNIAWLKLPETPEPSRA